MSARIADFNAARDAGMTPVRSARYAVYAERARSDGRTPLTAVEAAAQTVTR